jgi:hypothetical protein
MEREAIQEGKRFFTCIEGIEYRCHLKNWDYEIFTSTPEEGRRVSIYMERFSIDEKPERWLHRLLHRLLWIDRSGWKEFATHSEMRKEFDIAGHKYFYNESFVKRLAEECIKSKAIREEQERKDKLKLEQMKHKERI